MEETKELEFEILHDGPSHRRVEGSWLTKLDVVAEKLLHLRSDSGAVAQAILETALELVDYDRGVILSVARADADTLTPDSLQIFSSRARSQDDSTVSWGDVRNPEFVVNRSVVSRALVADKPVMVKSALQHPEPDSESQLRDVLCAPFELTADARVVLYLDRTADLTRPETNVDAFKTCGGRLLPLLSRAFLLQQLSESDDSRSADEPAPLAGGEETPSFHGIIGADEALQKLYRVIDKVKDNDLNICIIGESGTGKELLARAVHEAGSRRANRFVAENCGAISETLLESELFGHVKGAFTGAEEDREGLFEVADGGTLFLDEISDTSESMQRKLLRVLQEGVIRRIGSKDIIKVDVRVICASNRDLKGLVDKGNFRADLYYRLNVITLEMPPLRKRQGDIPLLVEHFVRQVCSEEKFSKRFSDSAMKALVEYGWPGNIRELRNVVRRVLLTSPRRVVARKDVAEFLKSGGPVAHSGEHIRREDDQMTIRIPARDSFNEIIDECERVVLEHALNECSWNKSRVTKVLKIPRQSLYNKIAKFDLQRTWDES